LLSLSVALLPSPNKHSLRGMERTRRGLEGWRNLFGFLFLFCLVDARDVYWRASESGLWSRPENWSEGRPPAGRNIRPHTSMRDTNIKPILEGDRVWITKSGEYVVTLDEIVSIESLTLGSSQGRPVFDVTLPLYVRQVNVSKNAVLQVLCPGTH